MFLALVCLDELQIPEIKQWCTKAVKVLMYIDVLLPENLHTYSELSAQAWTLYKAL
jgi:hypothetical protein